MKSNLYTWDDLEYSGGKCNYCNSNTTKVTFDGNFFVYICKVCYLRRNEIYEDDNFILN